MYKYIVNHIPIDNYKRPNLTMDAEYLTIHSTANLKSTAQNERDWLTNKTNTRQASFHIVVDENTAIECIPLDEVAWHAGDGNGKGNRASISIEICESGDREKTLQNTIELVAKMLSERDWDIDIIKQHYDWSGKNCPRILRDTREWIWFINEVSKRLQDLKKEDDNVEVPEWKYDGIKKLNKIGILDDLEGWKNKIDEPMPTWAVTILLSKLVDKMK